MTEVSKGRQPAGVVSAPFIHPQRCRCFTRSKLSWRKQNDLIFVLAYAFMSKIDMTIKEFLQN